MGRGIRATFRTWCDDTPDIFAETAGKAQSIVGECFPGRCSCATQSLAGGADVRAVKALLGHTDLKTTMVYLHADDERKRKAAKHVETFAKGFLGCSGLGWMSVFVRSEGSNDSERRLASIADKTFLKLWSYSNVYMGRERHGRIEGKELADLFVVCGNDIIIFSDKEVSWPNTGDVDVDWCRWYRRSIKKSADQLRKAERWIKEFPENLYMDEKCSVKLPVPISRLGKYRVHGILVANGAFDACVRMFGGSGSLVLMSDIKDDQHCNPSHANYRPFCVGDVHSRGAFLHVFDYRGLRLAMSELNTVTDFAEYLTSRSRLLRSEKAVFASGEEDLLSYYLQTEGEGGLHDFLSDKKISLGEFDSVAIEEGYWRSYVKRPEYIAKKEEEGPSYLWDAIISRFSHHLFAGTNPKIGRHDTDIVSAERALRIMALEPRVQRRGLAKALIEAMRSASEKRAGRFCRYVFSQVDEHKSKLVYVFLIMEWRPENGDEPSYESYRRARISLLEAYCFGLLSRYPNLEMVVGLAFDADPKVTGRKGGSEDLMAVEQSTWTEELHAEVESRLAALGIMTGKNVERGRMTTLEYPETPKPVQTRQQRRAAERRTHRKRRN